MSFAKVYGYDFLKKEFDVVIDVLNNYEKYKKLGVKIPKGIMLAGGPGLGKTLFATEFMDALTNRNKYIIRKNKFDDDFIDYLNETVNDAFKNAPSVVLLDDMDKYANNDSSHTDANEFVTIQSLLDEATGKDVFFLSTVNDFTALPKSLYRDGRFEKYHIDYPALNDSKLIIDKYLIGKKIDSDVDSLELAKLLRYRSPSSLEQIINNATITATYENKQLITRDILIDAVLKHIYGGTEKDDEINELELKHAAYHEAGHAIVSEVLDKGSIVLVSIGNYSSKVGAVTCTCTSDYPIYGVDIMKDNIAISLAGKAGVELFLNIIDTGATDDLTAASIIARNIVTKYAANSFKHYAVTSSDPKTPDLVRIEEIEINAIFDEAFAKARSIIMKYQSEYLKMVAILMKKKILSRKEIDSIMNY